MANKTRRHEIDEGLLAENLPFVRGKGQARCEAHTLRFPPFSAAARGDLAQAAAILAATEAIRAELGAAPDEDEETIRAKGLELLGRDPWVEGAWAEGRGLDLAAGVRIGHCTVENGLTMRIRTNIPHN